MALVLAFVTPITTAQRIAAVSVIGVAVLWLAVLHWALSRTPEGRGRLGSSPPLVLDLVSPAAMLTVAFVIIGMGPGPDRFSVASSSAGYAAGAVLMVPFSWTLRWLRWQWQHCQAGRPLAPSGLMVQKPDHLEDRRSGVVEPDGPTVG